MSARADEPVARKLAEDPYVDLTFIDSLLYLRRLHQKGRKFIYANFYNVKRLLRVWGAVLLSGAVCSAIMYFYSWTTTFGGYVPGGIPVPALPVLPANAQMARSPAQRLRLIYRVAFQNQGSDTVSVAVHVPIVGADPPRQEVSEIHFQPQPFNDVIDGYGNRMAQFDLVGVRPGQTSEVRVEAVVSCRYQVVDVDASRLRFSYPPGLRRYLQPSANFPCDDTAVKRRLHLLVEGENNPYYQLLRIYDFVRGLDFRLSEGPRDVRRLLDDRVAQCSDAASLFVTMARAAGVPCRFIGGIFQHTGDAEPMRIMHAWAECYLNDVGWFPVDPTMGRFDDLTRMSRFGELVPQYIRLWAETPRVLGGETLTARPQAAPLRISFEVQPLDAVAVGPSLLDRFPLPPLGTTVEPQTRALTVSSNPLAERFLREAEDAMKARHGALAAALARKSIDSDAAIWPSHRLLLEAAASTSTLSDECASYQSADSLPPWIRSCALGFCHLRLGPTSAAQRELEQVARLYPDNFYVHENLANFYCRTRQIGLALHQIAAVLRLNYRSLSGHRALVDLYAALEMWDAVERAAARSAAVFPQDAGFATAAGQACMRLHQYAAAAKWLKAALELRPRDGWLHCMLGWAESQTASQTTAARQQLERGLSLGVSGAERQFFENLSRRLSLERNRAGQL